MGQQGRTLAAKPNDFSFFLETRMVEGKNWLLKVVLTCVALSTCPTTHVPWHRHTSAPYIPNTIKRMWKKNSVRSKAALFDFGPPKHMPTPPFCPHPLSPNLKMLPSYKTLEFCVSLIHRTLTFFRAAKETYSWLFFPPQLFFDYFLQNVPPSLSLSSNWKYRTGQKWPCRDLNLWLKALTSSRGPWFWGPAGQSPCFWPQSFCCFFWCKMKVPVIYLSKRLAESRPVIMVNKTCWSHYGEERSNYNGFKQY